jgi:hypothetical protein
MAIIFKFETNIMAFYGNRRLESDLVAKDDELRQLSI